MNILIRINSQQEKMMSEYDDSIEDYDEDLYDGDEDLYDGDEDVLAIQEEYRRKRLVESLIGPCISTTFHVVLLIVMAFLIVDQTTIKKAEIQVELIEDEEVELEEPEPEDIEEPEEIEETEVTTPVVTTVAVEDVDTNDTALEDVNDEAPSTDDNSDIDMVSEITVSPSAFASANVMGGRGAAGRAGSLSKFGGDKKGQASLMNALHWLAKVQNPDGSWGSKSKPGLTGLALLTFLAHGDSHLSKRFGTTVKNAIQWLVQSPITKGHRHHAYDHAIKTYALCEAYSMTGLYAIKEPMKECVKLIIDNQQQSGAFDYSYTTAEGRQDLSLSGWNFQALKAAFGTGCEVEGLHEAIYKAVSWLKGMGGSGVSFTYESKNNNFNGAVKSRQMSMRAVGSLCLQLFGEGDCQEIKDDIRTIATVDIKRLEWQNAPEFSLYSWYYATQVMFQSGGKNWKPWNRRFQSLLNANQNKEGYWEYPNMHAGVAGHLGGALGEKIYATTLCGLMLTVYYRYLPSNKSVSILTKIANKKEGKKDVKQDKEEDVEDEEIELF